MGRGEITETPSYDQPNVRNNPYYDATQANEQPPAQHQTMSRAPMEQNPPPPAQFPPTQFPPTQFPPPPGPPPPQPTAYPPPPAAYPPPQNNPPLGTYPPQEPVAFPPQQAQQFPPQTPPPVNFQPIQFQQMQPQTPLQGLPVQLVAPNSQGWRTGLFDCMEDPTNAVITLLFPCVTFGQIVEIIDKGQTSCATGAIMYTLVWSFIGMPCIYSCTYRTRLRSMYGLVEAPAPDWIVHFVCEACALCQAYRELNRRGLDPSIGWIGNVARNPQLQQQPIPMMAPVPQRMM